MGQLPRPALVPPVFTLTVHHAPAGDGHVLRSLGEDARLMHLPRHTLELQENQREGRLLLQETQISTGLDLQRHVVVQADGTRGVHPRRHRQHAAALGTQLPNRRLKGLRPVITAMRQMFQLSNIHPFILLYGRAMPPG